MTRSSTALHAGGHRATSTSTSALIVFIYLFDGKPILSNESALPIHRSVLLSWWGDGIRTPHPDTQTGRAVGTPRGPPRMVVGDGKAGGGTGRPRPAEFRSGYDSRGAGPTTEVHAVLGTNAEGTGAEPEILGVLAASSGMVGRASNGRSGRGTKRKWYGGGSLSLSHHPRLCGLPVRPNLWCHHGGKPRWASRSGALSLYRFGHLHICGGEWLFFWI